MKPVLKRIGMLSAFLLGAVIPVQTLSALDVACKTEKTFYAKGAEAAFSIRIANDESKNVSASDIVLELADQYGKKVASIPVPVKMLTLAPGKVATNDNIRWKIPSDLKKNTVLFPSIRMKTDSGEKTWKDLWFVRIFEPGEDQKSLSVYDIAKFDYKGIPVYALDGGMSSEYSVEKSLAALDAGISHSWVTKNPGAGPRPVFASPEFLTKSLNKTVAYYDELGKDREYETVIIGSGVSSISYLARVLKAPILPLHFLTSVSSVKELDIMLDYTNDVEKNPSYAVVGYDYSVANFAVAWIKIAGIPKVYEDFIKRHKVKNVIFIGTTGVIGETLARKLIRNKETTEEVRPKDIYILHTSSSHLGYWKKTDSLNKVYRSGNYAFDSNELGKRLADIDDVELDECFQRINDWESGISQAQIQGFAKDLKENTSVKDMLLVHAVEDGEAIRHLYEFATYLMLEFYKKNESVLGKDGPPVKGVVMNPYLTAHPFYESVFGYVPYLFWQGSHTPASLASRYALIVRKEVGSYFKGVSPDSLKLLFNFGLNFKLFKDNPILEKTFRQKFPKVHVVVTDYSVDDVWNPNDNKRCSTEQMADELVEFNKETNLKQWEATLKPLTVDELKTINKKFNRMMFEDVKTP